MTPYGRNGVCGCYAARLLRHARHGRRRRRRARHGGSGGTLEGNYFSPREARDGARRDRVLRHAALLDGQGRHGGRLLRRDHAVLTAEQRPPHLAAITPQVAISRPLPRRLRPRRHPEPVLRRAVHRRAGRAGYGRGEHRPVAARGDAGGQARPVAAGTIAFDYLARPNDDPFYRDRSPIYGRGRIEVPALIIGGWRDGLLRGAPEMYRRSPPRAASRPASTWTPARTRAAARRSRR